MADQGGYNAQSEGGIKRPPPPEEYSNSGGNYAEENYNYDPNENNESDYYQAGVDNSYTYDPNAAYDAGGAPATEPYNEEGNNGGDGGGNNRSHGQNQGGHGNGRGGGGGYNQGGNGYNQGGNDYNQGGGGYNQGGGGYNQGGGGYNQGGGGYDQGGYNQGGGGGYNQYNQGQDYGAGGGGGYGFMSKKRRIIEDVYRILVPTKLVRTIIGKGGESIKAIKAIVGGECKISIYAQGTNNSEIPFHSSDRVMSIQASVESLSKILMELVPKLQLFEGGKVDVRLMIPAHSCSAVIGQKGVNIKQIKEDTTSSFIGVHNDPLPNSEEHIVKVINADLENAVRAVVRIYESIQETKGLQHVTFYDPQIWSRGEYGDTGSYLETAGDSSYRGRGRAPGHGPGSGGRGGNQATGYGRGRGGGGAEGGYYAPDQTLGYAPTEVHSYNYDPSAALAPGIDVAAKTGGQENYVSYPSY